MTEYQSTPKSVFNRKSFRIGLKFGILLLVFSAFCLSVSAQTAQVSQISLPAMGYYIAISPDSKTIAAAVNGTFYLDAVSPLTLPIQLIDINTGSPLRQLIGNTDYASGLTFSPDGKTLATYHNNGYIYLWDLSAKTLKSKFLVGAPSRGHNIQFLPDGQHLAMTEAGPLPVITLWDTASGQMTKFLIPTFDTYQQFDQLLTSEKVTLDSVVAFDISPDGKSLVAATAKENVWLWDLTSGNGQLISSGDDLPYVSIRSITFTNDGSQIAYYDQHTNELHVWNVASGSESTPIPLDADVAVVSPDGKTVAWAKSGGDSVSIAPIADPNSATIVAIPGGIPHGLSLSFTPDGKEVIVNGSATLSGQVKAVLDVVHMP